MIFEMAPYNFQFDFRKISFNPFESSDGKFFQDDRDSDLNYFDEINIPSKETTNINGTDIKKFLYKTQRFENISALNTNNRGPETNFENFCNLLNKTGSSFNIICLKKTCSVILK